MLQHIMLKEEFSGKTLIDVQNSLNFSWSCIGDFNTILGAHEHRGTYSLAIVPMKEFAKTTYFTYLQQVAVHLVQWKRMLSSH